jgi:predicted ABC-type ATPase
VKKNLFIISGCNGAGKTTASFMILPDILNCREFVNADEIAKGLSPFQPERVAIEAGRIMLTRIRELLAEEVSFAFETTLATRSYVHVVRNAIEKGYSVTLLFFWLQTIELAQERVMERVRSGGHNILPNVIRRRYFKGINNLFELYLPEVESVLIFDNSEGKPELIAEKIEGNKLTLHNEKKFLQLYSYYEHKKR